MDGLRLIPSTSPFPLKSNPSADFLIEPTPLIIPLGPPLKSPPSLKMSGLFLPLVLYFFGPFPVARAFFGSEVNPAFGSLSLGLSRLCAFLFS